MNWVLAIALALAAFVFAAFVLKTPRRGWEALAAALLLGIAGYGLQASPGLPGSPTPPPAIEPGGAEGLVEARRALVGREGMPSSNWLVVGDALVRNGNFGDAAGMLLAAVEEDPEDYEAWLALGNALTAHADGTLTPAALYAYRKASEAAPAAPGPPFFLGLGHAQAGQFDEARDLWAEALKRTPEDSPIRPELEARLARLLELEAMIEMQRNMQGGER
ncbi:hypothetical protein GCM10011371_31390 [Novosphingobium marinum]|uniref:Cytochrome c-type biogenesis protein CcmH n=1 Tax=Novosphingobium marinum TaxID=1514948 RepID=A0A7Z0BX15_9SPHN|nr:tetratricopeptide repeat protein [Novosphingobium marinum]NYH96877.1 cytochrome c-type biogenesis protein CcmH [Novosphingobium marinum]GGC41642.1 hypothetical protein GCM10011371_31390 [Novosphingobium marinum]